MSEHKLINDTLYVERDKDKKAKGIIGRCTCGWTTGHRFSSAIAHNTFQDHLEEAAKVKA